jgi:predicted dehydrogenase
MPSQPDSKKSDSVRQKSPSGDFNRRDFLKGAVAGGVVVGGGLGAFYYGYEKALGSPVRVGIIGTGDQGGVLIGAINPAYVEVKSIADIRPYSIRRALHGDSYSDDALKFKPGLIAKYGWKNENHARKHVKVYGTYQQLLENAKADGLEGVIIALPLHLHAEAAVAAMNAGLHVLTEKLMAHSVHECKEMARMAKQTALLLAVGHQRHYNILYANAVETIRQGLLGDVHYIRAQWHRESLPGEDPWQPPLPPDIKSKDPQSEKLSKKLKTWQKELAKADGRAIDLWESRIGQLKAQIDDKMVKAEKYGYQIHRIRDASGKAVYEAPPIEELIRWRLWDRTGAGLMGEFGGQQFDAASLFVAAAHGGVRQIPLCISAAAGRPLYPPDRDADDHAYCILEYPAPGYDAEDPLKKLKKIGAHFALVNGNGFGGCGEIVFGSKRTMLLENERAMSIVPDPAAGGKISVSAVKGSALDTQASGPAEMAGAMLAADADLNLGFRQEIEHWTWCIRNRAAENNPRCHPAVALYDAVIAHAANISAREGRPVEFKPEWFDIDKDQTPEDIAPDLKRYTG